MIEDIIIFAAMIATGAAAFWLMAPL